MKVFVALLVTFASAIASPYTYPYQYTVNYGAAPYVAAPYAAAQYAAQYAAAPVVAAPAVAAPAAAAPSFAPQYAAQQYADGSPPEGSAPTPTNPVEQVNWDTKLDAAAELGWEASGPLLRLTAGSFWQQPANVRDPKLKAIVAKAATAFAEAKKLGADPSAPNTKKAQLQKKVTGLLGQVGDLIVDSSLWNKAPAARKATYAKILEAFDDTATFALNNYDREDMAMMIPGMSMNALQNVIPYLMAV